MGQSLSKIAIHFIYSTKNRLPMIPERNERELYRYQAGIFRKWDCPSLEIGGIEDHVHALFLLSKNVAPAKIFEEVKKSSSIWMKSPQGAGNPNFYWQRGYAAFSVSESKIEAVRQYIQNQREHHKKVSYQDEVRELLMLHQVKFDERYVWD